MSSFRDIITIVLFLLSIVLVILGSITMSFSNQTDETAKNNVKRSGVGVLIIGIIFGLATIIPIFHLFKGLSYTPSGTFYF